MARVQLITTGVMEERALARNLRRCFPDHEFVPKPRLDGFTSAKLPPDLASMSPTQRLLLNIHKFASTLIGAFAPGGREDRPRPDFVLAVEDLELYNADAPERVTRAVRDSVVHNLERWPLAGPTREKVRAALQERCSFHLMAPMTEAYFFADPAALAAATAPGLDHPNLFAPTCDVEAFAVDDPAYLTPLSAPALRWQTANRRQHPKHYLEYLTDAKLDGGSRYHEPTLGAGALERLDWATVLARQATARFARSLLADLADMLEGEPLGCRPSELLARAGCHPLTWPPPRERVLRNI